jgi:hypothetical protein
MLADKLPVVNKSRVLVECSGSLIMGVEIPLETAQVFFAHGSSPLAV